MWVKIFRKIQASGQLLLHCKAGSRPLRPGTPSLSSPYTVPVPSLDMDIPGVSRAFNLAQQPANLREFGTASATSSPPDVAAAKLVVRRNLTKPPRQSIGSTNATSTQRGSPFSTLLDWGQQGATKLSRGLQPFPAGFPAGMLPLINLTMVMPKSSASVARTHLQLGSAL